MSLLLRRPLIAAAVGALLAIAIVAGVAWARTDDDPQAAFTGCLDLSSGQISAVALGEDPAIPCSNDLQQVSWLGEAVIGIDGQDGAAGADGADGDDGQAGPEGSTGVPGPTGQVGPMGPSGPAGSTGPTGLGGPSGSTGPAGAAGPAGAVGPVGPVGPIGNVIASGTSAPTAADGEVGDLYLDTTATVLYGPKTATGWGTGLALGGDDGRSFLSGDGDPNALGAAIGVTGDLFVDTSTNILWGPKAPDGSWPQRARLEGTDGNTIRHGTDPVPPVDGAQAGDFYIDVINQILYGPSAIDAAGELFWPMPGVSLVGDEGQQGPRGATILSDATATPPTSGVMDGDFYLDTRNNVLFGPAIVDDAGAVSWPPGVELVGPPGAAGATIRSGSSPPTAADGELGDYYLYRDGAVVELYGPKTASGWPVSGTSLVGPEGPAGINALGGVDGATASGPVDLPPTTTLTSLLTLDVTAPSSGYLIVNATASFDIGEFRYVSCRVTRTATSGLFEGELSVIGGADLQGNDADNGNLAVWSDTVLIEAEAGSNQLQVECARFLGRTNSIDRRAQMKQTSITAIFSDSRL